MASRERSCAARDLVGERRADGRSSRAAARARDHCPRTPLPVELGVERFRRSPVSPEVFGEAPGSGRERPFDPVEDRFGDTPGGHPGNRSICANRELVLEGICACEEVRVEEVNPVTHKASPKPKPRGHAPLCRYLGSPYCYLFGPVPAGSATTETRHAQQARRAAGRRPIFDTGPIPCTALRRPHDDRPLSEPGDTEERSRSGAPRVRRAAHRSSRAAPPPPGGSHSSSPSTTRRARPDIGTGRRTRPTLRSRRAPVPGEGVDRASRCRISVRAPARRPAGG